jgi:TonB family protein
VIVVAILLLAQVTPSPSPTAASLCYQDAHVIKAVVPNTEGLSQETLMQPLATEMQVTVASDGSVKGVSISKSSGHLDFDMAAIRAAKQSTYSPKLVDCKAVEGTATFRASLTQEPSP